MLKKISAAPRSRILCSSYYGSNYPEEAFDSNINTNFWKALGTDLDPIPYVGQDFYKPMAVLEYKYYSNLNIRAATGWEVQVSDDGITWTTIDTVTGITEQTKIQVFKIASPVSKRFIRFYDVKGGSTSTAGVEIGYMELVVDEIDDALPELFNVIPGLTNHYNALCSSYYGSNYPEEAFDSDTSYNFWKALGTDLDPIPYVGYDFFNAPKKVVAYQYHSTLNTYTATGWEVQVSDDGITWTTIDTVTGITEQTKIQLIYIASPVSKRFIRFYDVKGGGTTSSIGVEIGYMQLVVDV